MTSSDLTEALCLFGGFAPTQQNLLWVENRLQAHDVGSTRRIGKDGNNSPSTTSSSTAMHPHDDVGGHGLSRGLFAALSPSASAGSSLAASASTAETSSSPFSVVEEGDSTLIETIQLAMGIMPGSLTTASVIPLSGSCSRRTRDEEQMLHSADSNPNAFVGGRGEMGTPPKGSTPDRDQTLREMVHMATGLPISTLATHSTFAKNSIGQEESTLHREKHVDNTTNKAPGLLSGERLSANLSGVRESTADYDQTLREMVHMATGLPISTFATHSTFAKNGLDENASPRDDESIKGLFYYLTRKNIASGRMLTPPVSTTAASADHNQVPTTWTSRLNTVLGWRNYNSNTSTNINGAEGESSQSKNDHSQPQRIANAAKAMLNAFSIKGGRSVVRESSLPNGGAASAGSTADARRAARRERAKAPGGIPEELLGF